MKVGRIKRTNEYQEDDSLEMKAKLVTGKNQVSFLLKSFTH